MLTTDFREKVLLEPLRQGYDELFAVVGFGTGPAAMQHLTGGGDQKKDPHFANSGKFTLVIGMYASQGIPRSDHDLFVSLNQKYSNFECRYLETGKPVHSKAYVWSKGGEAALAYVGSANYSMSASRGTTEELMTEADPEETLIYCKAVYGRSVHCVDVTHLRVRSEVSFVSTVNVKEAVPKRLLEGCPSVVLPLTAYGKGAEVPNKSGLNWGQRPEERREPNQAYLSVPALVQREGFFPPRGQFFTVLTDDGESFIMSRNQDGGKALHTPNNSQIGRYFRQRLQVRSGSPVRLEDLLRYGRLDVRFYYLGDDKYFLDFSAA